ncbi:MAG: NADPH:quinone oxidoreductase family protein [Pseudomonadota bacterium]
MRAVLCQQHGIPASLTLTDIAEPTPGPNDVAIAVDACGLNFPDVLMIAGRYQVQPPLPFVPGLEIAGRITALGERVRGFTAGQRVGAFMASGGLAELAVAPAASVYPIPDEVPAPLAAAFTLAYGTSYHALHDRGAINSGDTVLVLGAAGGVGLAAVDIAVAAGARVIAAASTAEKLDAAKALGATDLINYVDESLVDRVRELTDKRGADIIYDPVGAEFTDQALRCLAWGGRLLIVGFAAGDIASLPANRLLLKGAAAVGVYWGQHVANEPSKHAHNMGELQRLLQTGLLHPTIQPPVPLEDAIDALTTLAERRAIGKLVVAVR